MTGRPWGRRNSTWEPKRLKTSENRIGSRPRTRAARQYPIDRWCRAAIQTVSRMASSRSCRLPPSTLNGPAADEDDGGLGLGLGVAVAISVRRSVDEDGDGKGVGAAVGGTVEAVGVLAVGRGVGAQICSTVR